MKSETLSFDKKIIDFVIYHALGINFFNNTGKSLAKCPSNLHSPLPGINIEPPVVLFDTIRKDSKGSGSACEQKPCLYTTGLNIMVLSILSGILSEGNTYHIRLAEELRKIARLQLSYCMDMLKDFDKLALAELTGIINGFLAYYNNEYGNAEYDYDYYEFIKHLDSYYQHALERLGTQIIDTLELGLLLESLIMKNNFFGFEGTDEAIMSIVIDVLSRRTKTGLLTLWPDSCKILSFGEHHRVTAALLSSSRYVIFDCITEDILYLLNRFCRDIFLSSENSFTGRRCNRIKYSTYDLGAMIYCFDEVIKQKYDSDKHYMESDCFIKSLLNDAIDSFNNCYSREIAIIHNLYRYIHYQFVKRYYKNNICCPIFPKSIRFSYPGPIVTLNNKGSIHLADTLHLCYRLLTSNIYFDDYNDALSDRISNDNDTDNTMELIKFILELGKTL